MLIRMVSSLSNYRYVQPSSRADMARSCWNNIVPVNHRVSPEVISYFLPCFYSTILQVIAAWTAARSETSPSNGMPLADVSGTSIISRRSLTETNVWGRRS